MTRLPRFHAIVSQRGVKPPLSIVHVRSCVRSANRSEIGIPSARKPRERKAKHRNIVERKKRREVVSKQRIDRWNNDSVFHRIRLIEAMEPKVQGLRSSINIDTWIRSFVAEIVPRGFRSKCIIELNGTKRRRSVVRRFIDLYKILFERFPFDVTITTNN